LSADAVVGEQVPTAFEVVGAADALGVCVIGD